jgi:hypothetical protein
LGDNTLERKKIMGMFDEPYFAVVVFLDETAI